MQQQPQQQEQLLQQQALLRRDAGAWRIDVTRRLLANDHAACSLSELEHQRVAISCLLSEAQAQDRAIAPAGAARNRDAEWQGLRDRVLNDGEDDYQGTLAKLSSMMMWEPQRRRFEYAYYEEELYARRINQLRTLQRLDAQARNGGSRYFIDQPPAAAAAAAAGSAAAPKAALQARAGSASTTPAVAVVVAPPKGALQAAASAATNGVGPAKPASACAARSATCAAGTAVEAQRAPLATAPETGALALPCIDGSSFGHDDSGACLSAMLSPCHSLAASVTGGGSGTSSGGCSPTPAAARFAAMTAAGAGSPPSPLWHEEQASATASGSAGTSPIDERARFDADDVPTASPIEATRVTAH
jgi:hypothetical protein